MSLVATVDGVVVGFVSVSATGHFAGEQDAYIGELVVDERFEGEGVGRALMAAAEAAAIERGHRCVTLTTGAANVRAIGFYESLGFDAEDVKLTKVLGGEPPSPTQPSPTQPSPTQPSPTQP